MQHSTGYTLGFAAAVCVFCSIFVAGSAVALKPLQEANKVLDRQKKVLGVAGVECVDTLSQDQIATTFGEVKAVLVDMTGDPAPKPVSVEDAGMTAEQFQKYDPRKAAKDPAQWVEVEANRAKVKSLARYEIVYKIEAGAIESPCPEGGTLSKQLIVPIQGPGLWSTLYGFVSLTGEQDYNTVNGLTFYAHAETPGLGGEVDNPKWKAKWIGKQVRKNNQGEVKLKVVKGAAKDEFGVDGLSGATITSDGVSYGIQFWLGDTGFTPDVLRSIGEADGTSGGES
jgi:Na+-transporting NADH:ubiquinone oxidoreductase subunit C